MQSFHSPALQYSIGVAPEWFPVWLPPTRQVLRVLSHAFKGDTAMCFRLLLYIDFQDLRAGLYAKHDAVGHLLGNVFHAVE